MVVDLSCADKSLLYRALFHWEGEANEASNSSSGEAASVSSIDASTKKVLEHVTTGDAIAALREAKSTTFAGLFALTEAENLETTRDAVLAHLSLQSSESLVLPLAVASAFLSLFMRLNWTGPFLTEDEKKQIHGFFFPSFAAEEGEEAKKKIEDQMNKLNEQARKLLDLDGETVYIKSSLPVLLFWARTLLLDGGKARLAAGGELVDTWHWWTLRTIKAIAHVLSGPTSSLLDDYLSFFAPIEEHLKRLCEQPSNQSLCGSSGITPKGALCLLYIECTLAYRLLWANSRSRAMLSKAKECANLHLSLGGALGVRTKFQTFKTAQLILHAARRGGGEESALFVGTEKKGWSGNEENDKKVKTISLSEVDENNPLLERPSVEREEGGGGEGEKELKEEELSSVEQCVILANSEEVKEENPNDGLSEEEQSAYVQFAVHHHTNWSVFSSSLLLRCRLESKRTKTVDRSMMQLQVLVDQFADLEPPPSERIRFVHATPYPPRWKMQKELGQGMMKLGCVRTALDLFLSLEMWEDAALCLIAADEEGKAVKLLRERIEVAKDANLMCVLGELTQDDAMLEEAWVVSRHRSARAQRSLGRRAFQRGDFAAAISHFEKSVKVNGIHHNTFFTMGCACMTLAESIGRKNSNGNEEKEGEDKQSEEEVRMAEEEQALWDKAVLAFSRVVALNPEAFEAFGNLGSIFIRLKKYDAAHHALTEAIREGRTNWRLWENLLTVCVATGRLDGAVDAMSTLLELNQKGIDLKILDIVTDTAIDQYKKFKETNTEEGGGEEARRCIFVENVQALFEKLSSKGVNTWQVWKIAAKFHNGTDHAQKAMDCHKRQLRSAQAPGWEKNIDMFRTVVECIDDLTHAMLREGSSGSKFGARSTISIAMKKAQLFFDATPEMDRLRELLALVAE